MKISKLFHWCYAFLMLLPICAIGVKCGYVMLNKNAYQSYTGSYNYISSVKFNNILTNNTTTEAITINGNTYYKFLNPNLVNYYVGNTSIGNIGSNIQNCVIYVISDLKINNISYPTIKTLMLYGRSTSITYNLYDFEFNDNYYFTFQTDPANGKIYDSLGNLMNYSYTNTVNNNSFSISLSIINMYKLSSSNTKYLLDVNTDLYYHDTTLSSVFYSSLQELDKVEFFSWAKNSFLSQPFMYIGNLFGIPNVHPIFTFLSYWCAISIIWLVFDLFMYMPLLVHKWIDKAKVE